MFSRKNRRQKMAKKLPSDLTDKQKMFCLEYLVDFNATQAAIRAGYSENTASEIGSENLGKPHIQTFIQESIKERQTRTEITADKVLKEYAKIAFFDIRSIYNESNSLKPIADLDDTAGSVIAGVEVDEIFEGSGKDKIYLGNTVKVKLNNKINALDSIAKHLGMFEKDNAQKQILVAPQIILGNVANKP